MSARTVRQVVVAVCVVGIAGMIVASVGDSNALALTFGLVTVAAVVCLMVATAVGGQGPADEAQAQRVEATARALVESGADEGQVRQLVREANRLGAREGREMPGRGARRTHP